MSEFKAGDVVELKSGSMRMVVESIGPAADPEEAGCVCCAWYDERSSIVHAVIHSVCLKKVED